MTPQIENKITKNTRLSIGLAAMLLIATFYGGLSLGQLQRELESHSDRLEEMIPRKEAENQLSTINAQLMEIRDTQKQILFKLNKK